MRTGFDLNGRVFDLESVMKLSGNNVKEFVGIDSGFHDDVCREGDFGCTHSPDVKIVDFGNAIHR